LIHRLSIWEALVTGARHGEPSVSEAPAERGVLLAIVHMAPDPLAIDLPHVVGEKVRDILIGRPVHRHTEIIAVLVAELLPEVVSGEPVIAEPIEVRELLDWKLVKLPIRPTTELRAHEIVEIKGRQGDVLELALHQVVDRQGGTVAEV